MNPQRYAGVVWPSLFVVLTATYAYWVSQRELVSSRPPVPDLRSVDVILPTPGERTIDSRMWQDPLDDAIKDWRSLDKSQRANDLRTWFDKNKNGKGDEKADQDKNEDRDKEVTSNGTEIAGLGTKVTRSYRTAMKKRYRLVANEPIICLPVFIPGGPYAEDKETRLRIRYSVVAALADAGYSPSLNTQMGYVVPRIFVRTPASWSEREVVVPIKVYTANYGPDIVVLWINEEELGKKPLLAVHRILNEIFSDVEETNREGFQVCLIGPTSSDGLKDMADEARSLTPNTKNDTLKLWQYNSPIDSEIWTQGFCPLLDPCFLDAGKTRDKVVILSPRATADDRVIDFVDNDFFKLERITGADSLLAEALGKELDSRGVLPGRIALITEQDTAYGRAIEETFRLAFESYKATELVTYKVLKGIDGQLPGDKEDSPKSKNGNGDSTAPKEVEEQQPEGRSQYDYLIRLGERIRAEEAGRDDAPQLTAIGVVGSDVYDKLLVLRALKPQFPNCMFFTTDLDAIYEHPDELQHTQNLIIASHFGLRLNRELQGVTPPFRDNYQTATYLATRSAISRHTLQTLLQQLDSLPQTVGRVIGSQADPDKSIEDLLVDKQYGEELWQQVVMNHKELTKDLTERDRKSVEKSIVLVASMLSFDRTWKNERAKELDVAVAHIPAEDLQNDSESNGSGTKPRWQFANDIRVQSDVVREAASGKELLAAQTRIGELMANPLFPAAARRDVENVHKKIMTGTPVFREKLLTFGEISQRFEHARGNLVVPPVIHVVGRNHLQQLETPSKNVAAGADVHPEFTGNNGNRWHLVYALLCAIAVLSFVGWITLRDDFRVSFLFDRGRDQFEKRWLNSPRVDTIRSLYRFASVSLLSVGLAVAIPWIILPPVLKQSDGTTSIGEMGLAMNGMSPLDGHTTWTRNLILVFAGLLAVGFVTVLLDRFIVMLNHIRRAGDRKTVEYTWEFFEISHLLQFALLALILVHVGALIVSGWAWWLVISSIIAWSALFAVATHASNSADEKPEITRDRKARGWFLSYTGFMSQAERTERNSGSPQRKLQQRVLSVIAYITPTRDSGPESATRAKVKTSSKLLSDLRFTAFWGLGLMIVASIVAALTDPSATWKPVSFSRGLGIRFIDGAAAFYAFGLVGVFLAGLMFCYLWIVELSRCVKADIDDPVSDDGQSKHDEISTRMENHYDRLWVIEKLTSVTSGFAPNMMALLLVLALAYHPLISPTPMSQGLLVIITIAFVLFFVPSLLVRWYMHRERAGILDELRNHSDWVSETGFQIQLEKSGDAETIAESDRPLLEHFDEMAEGGKEPPHGQPASQAQLTKAPPAGTTWKRSEIHKASLEKRKQQIEALADGVFRPWSESHWGWIMGGGASLAILDIWFRWWIYGL